MVITLVLLWDRGYHLSLAQALRLLSVLNFKTPFAMEKNFQKYGLSHYLGTPILQIHSAVSIIKHGLTTVNPDLLNARVSQYSDRTVGQTLDTINDAIDNINEITKGVDDLLITEEHKKQWDEAMKTLRSL
jgi:hypothetical protein